MKSSNKKQAPSAVSEANLDQIQRQLAHRADRLREGGVSLVPKSTSAQKISDVGSAQQPILQKEKSFPPANFIDQQNAVQPTAFLPTPFALRGEQGLESIKEILGDCRRCGLCSTRNKIVFGQGHTSPELVFVGEGPGAEEDKTGLPFVGAAGDLLTKMITAMGLARQDVYICNVVKCRPPGNRVPERDEMAQCGPFLRAQLQALSPRVIVALGRTPTQFLLETQAPMSKLRGQFTHYEGVPLMPTYHPAYLLRNPSAKKDVWEDLQQVMKKLGLPR